MDKEGEGCSKPREQRRGRHQCWEWSTGVLGAECWGQMYGGWGCGLESWRGEAAGRLAHPLQHQACLNRKLLPQADSLQGSSEEGLLLVSRAGTRLGLSALTPGQFRWEASRCPWSGLVNTRPVAACVAWWKFPGTLSLGICTLPGAGGWAGSQARTHQGHSSEQWFPHLHRAALDRLQSTSSLCVLLLLLLQHSQ